LTPGFFSTNDYSISSELCSCHLHFVIIIAVRRIPATQGRNHRSAQLVFGWSFYRQGTSGESSSADEFLDAALAWFGDSDPRIGTAWEKGERLAKLIAHRRTILVLDGLEPLQNPPGPQEGRLREPSLQALLRELAAFNTGLCVITTRLPVADIADHEHTSAPHCELEQLSSDAGAKLLRALGVKGQEAELQSASNEFGGHCLALTLLGSYLSDAYNGDIRCRKQVSERLAHDVRQGVHAPGAAILRGWARSSSGHTSEGIACIEEGIRDNYRVSGAIVGMPYFLALKAEALHLANRTSEALETIKEAQVLVERLELRWWSAELHRLRGVFLAAMGADETQIEASFCEAIRTARAQKSISLQRRAEASYAEYRRQKLER
jgi:hypothetical protein